MFVSLPIFWLIIFHNFLSVPRGSWGDWIKMQGISEIFLSITCEYIVIPGTIQVVKWQYALKKIMLLLTQEIWP